MLRGVLEHVLDPPAGPQPVQQPCRCGRVLAGQDPQDGRVVFVQGELAGGAVTLDVHVLVGEHHLHRRAGPGDGCLDGGGGGGDQGCPPVADPARADITAGRERGGVAVSSVPARFMVEGYGLEWRRPRTARLDLKEVNSAVAEPHTEPHTEPRIAWSLGSHGGHGGHGHVGHRAWGPPGSSLKGQERVDASVECEKTVTTLRILVYLLVSSLVIYLFGPY